MSIFRVLRFSTRSYSYATETSPMKITVHSSKMVKPVYSSGAPSPASTSIVVPLTALDKVNYDDRIGNVYFFHPPAPPNSVLAAGLARALAVHREWAGRFCVDAANGAKCGIQLNDAGVRFVEATADVALGSIKPYEPTPELLRLRPSGDDDVNAEEELMQVQATRFACGSLAVGTATHHFVGDGHGRCSLMTDWGKAARGATIDTVPVRDRASVFTARNPPRVEFQHRGVEFSKPAARTRSEEEVVGIGNVAMHRFQFSQAMITELKSRAAGPYSTIQCVTAHLWRCITKARRLDADTVTKLRIAVNGRPRMQRYHPHPHPHGLNEYTGNVVLWAHPTATAGELVARPLQWAAELVHRAVRRVDDSYFRSFVDFASSGAVEEEGLLPIDDPAKRVQSPDVYVSNLKGIPVYDCDFGAGRPFLFTRSYPPEEGMVFIMPPFSGDGSMHVQVALFGPAMEIFRDCCYSLESSAGSKL